MCDYINKVIIIASKFQNFDTMNDNVCKDMLVYILIDKAVESNFSYDSIKTYFCKIRLVCKLWKDLVDKYIHRYIKIFTCSNESINNTLHIRSNNVTTIWYIQNRKVFK